MGWRKGKTHNRVTMNNISYNINGIKEEEGFPVYPGWLDKPKGAGVLRVTDKECDRE